MRLRSLLVVAFFMAASVLPLTARVIYDTGPCSNGSTWIVVTTLDDKGRVTSIRGTNCDGVTWKGHCTIIGIAEDPTVQIDPGYRVYYHEGDNGSWVRYSVDGNGIYRSMWGYDTDGKYWRTDESGVNLL